MHCLECYQDINTTIASFRKPVCTVRVDTGYGSVRICVQVEMMSHLNETSSSALHSLCQECSCKL